VQSFTARMPLLTAASAFGLGRRCWSSRQQCHLHCLRVGSNPQFSQSRGALDIEADPVPNKGGAARPLRLARSQGLGSASV